jgi:hypothetical protein
MDRQVCRVIPGRGAAREPTIVGMAAKSDRPIFVMGCPRSGTTMLQLMLHSHPRIAIPPETRFVVTAYERRRDFGDLEYPANRRALAQWIVGRAETKFLDLGLDPEPITEEIMGGPPALGAALGTVFQAYARRFGKPRWGDKRPSYIQHLDACCGSSRTRRWCI